MKEPIKPENLFLVEYSDTIDEKKLNWGFKDSYFGEEKIPILFIFSNFPHTIKTNKQSLLGSIRTYVEERKGIIFFPTKIKENVKQYVLEALKKEKVELDFLPYSDDKYNPDYLSHICNTYFKIKNINFQEVIKMGTKNIHQEMIDNLRKREDKDVICFIIDKEKKQIIDSLNMDQTLSRKKAKFDEIIKDKNFNPRFFDLFLGKGSITEQIKRFCGGNDWKFHSILIFYSARRKRVFIQDLPGSVFFLNANENTFIWLNTDYFLLSYNYDTKPEQKIVITKNLIAQRFDVSVDNEPAENPVFKRDIMSTFPGCTESVNQFLTMITHTQSNESRFYYDKKCVFVKTAGNKYIIDTYEAK